MPSSRDRASSQPFSVEVRQEVLSGSSGGSMAKGTLGMSTRSLDGDFDADGRHPARRGTIIRAMDAHCFMGPLPNRLNCLNYRGFLMIVAEKSMIVQPAYGGPGRPVLHERSVRRAQSTATLRECRSWRRQVGTRQSWSCTFRRGIQSPRQWCCSSCRRSGSSRPPSLQGRRLRSCG